MDVRKVVTILLAVGTLLAFALVSTTPVMAASKKDKAKETVEKAKKSTKKAKSEAEKKVKKASETTKALPKGKININTASKEDLMMLPGIGEARADAIIKARKATKFTNAEDVMGRKIGVGKKVLEGIKPYLKF